MNGRVHERRTRAIARHEDVLRACRRLLLLERLHGALDVGARPAAVVVRVELGLLWGALTTDAHNGERICGGGGAVIGATAARTRLVVAEDISQQLDV